MLGITTIKRRIRAARVPENALQGAVAFARELPAAEIDAMRQRLIEVERIRKSVPSIANPLPIEALAEEELRERKKLLAKEQDVLTKAIPLASKYKQLSLEPLSWRDKQGFPRLVVFRLDSPNFVLEGRTYFRNLSRWIEGKIQSPELPQAIKDCFRDAAHMMMNEADWRLSSRIGSITYTCHFTGIIPAEVKAKIAEARQDFGEDIFIIGEVKGWKEDVYTDPDPLVVGWDGSALWLIDVFDVTTLEQAMALYPTTPTDNRA